MNTSYGDLFTTDMIIQLNTVFDKMERALTLRLYPDARDVSGELLRYLKALEEFSDKIRVEEEPVTEDAERPYVRVFLQDGTDCGYTFHGVPGGHEFTPFVLSLYNASGPGQPINPVDRREAMRIGSPVNIKVMVSLNCTLCPELVQAAGRLASLNENVSVDVYDLNHFDDLRAQYNVQSVPCFTINDGNVQFGKKSLPTLAALCLEAAEQEA